MTWGWGTEKRTQETSLKVEIHIFEFKLPEFPKESLKDLIKPKLFR